MRSVDKVRNWRPNEINFFSPPAGSGTAIATATAITLACGDCLCLNVGRQRRSRRRDYLLYIAYSLQIDCQMLALNAHMPSHHAYGHGPKAQGAAQAAGLARYSSSLSSWALGIGPGPISIIAEHMGIKGNRKAIDMQYMTGNLALAFAFAYLRTVEHIVPWQSTGNQCNWS